jgi:hypothetical protein
MAVKQPGRGGEGGGALVRMYGEAYRHESFYVKQIHAGSMIYSNDLGDVGMGTWYNSRYIYMRRV